jgi:ATPase subunit of ABC transporter with duplicated ATPase domains
MTLLALRDLAVATPRPLFAGLSLTINPGDRIGLVAANGAGKSTLLRCLAGQSEPTAGTITRRRGLKTGFVEQDVPAALLDLPMHEAIRRALPPAERAANEWKIDLLLETFATPPDLPGKKLSELSGGWQRMALIARAWIAEPDLLLLDEPSNHLDLDRLAILEDWLAHQTEGTALLIASHDRAFLDAVTTHTLFLRPEASALYAHPFSTARPLLAADDERREKVFAREMKEADRLRHNAGKLKNVGINSGSDLLLKKAKQLTARAEAIEQTARPLAKQRAADLRLSNSGTHAKVLVTLDNLQVTTPDGRPLFRTGKLRIHQGERILLTGPNGTGKSQFVRLLRQAAEGQETQGITLAASLVPGYIDQQMSQLPPAETPAGFITARFRLGDQRSTSLLAGAGFDLDTQRRRIDRLSPGQKARLGLLALRLAEPNFYLMDEPTNHVDIAGQERLEEEILAHGATCILVSHDRAFIAAIATRILRIDGKTLVEEDQRR